MGVYVITTENSGLRGSPVKVGVTNGPPGKRLAQLQTGNPHKLALLFFSPIEGHFSRIVERDFSKAHALRKLQGEWFAITAREATGWMLNYFSELADITPEPYRDDFWAEVGITGMECKS